MGRFVAKDTFFKKAKKDGSRARSAYKLKEIQDKFHIVAEGDTVMDLGCAPGSFLQVLSQIVTDRGFVVGIDILPVNHLPLKNVAVITADIRAIDVKGVLQRYSLPSFDVITCDIAPNLSGICEVDDKNIEELYHVIHGLLLEGLRKGGNLLIKHFFFRHV